MTVKKDGKFSMRIETNYLCMLDDLCKYYMRTRADMITYLIRREYIDHAEDIQRVKEELSTIDTMFAYETVCGDR